MARQARMTLGGWAHQVMVRGNNGQLVFADDADKHQWLMVAAREAAHHGVDVHAYVLLPDRVHWLVTPRTDVALAAWMQALGRAYVQYFNRRHGRRGTLWEGRFRAGLLQPERHLLACMAYFDLCPVMANLAPAPQAWPWSSHGHYVGTHTEKWLRPHAMVWSLGNTPFAREAAYARLVAAGLSQDVQRALLDNVSHGWPLGDVGFLQRLQALLGQPVQRRKPGRPRQGALETPDLGRAGDNLDVSPNNG
jgi:putative transposase